ncbi:MAG: ribonuclease III [Geobacteraceae bacterium]|nr:ribonuclease III [Geobacteraceae bacterium]
MPGNEKVRTPVSVTARGRFSRLESAIGYRFGERRLLREACTHRSYAFPSRRQGLRDNGRLEFLGNAVLGFVVSGRLLALFPECGEGSLSRMKASLVGTPTLAGIARSLRLGEFLRLGRAEENTGGRSKPSVLAKAFQALVAAVYLDGGIFCAERMVLRLFGPLLERDVPAADVRDYKTMLQELSHSLRCIPPCYFVRAVTGPDHDLCFTVTVRVGDDYFATGTGKTRREAEQNAAREAILLLKEDRSAPSAGGSDR